MKRKILLAVSILSLIILTSFRAEKRPQFKFERDIIDIGRINRGKSITVHFKFVNKGMQPLIIQDIETTCGCTVAKFTKNPILSGKLGEIAVTYSAISENRFIKELIVKSNAVQPIFILYIKGIVVNGNK